MQTSMIFPLLLQLLNISTTHAQALTAYVKVTNWTCPNFISPSCSNYQLKIGYANVKGCPLSINSKNAFAQNDNQQKFPLSSRNGTKFTYVPEKTSNEHLIVVVFDETNQFQATCEDIKQRREHGNKTFIHTDAYFTTSSAKYSFDIEIITVCPTTLCTGLFCNRCVTTDERTTLSLISSTSTRTSTNTNKNRTAVTSEFTTTTLVVTTHLKLGDKSNITTTSIALIVVIIALVLVIMILLYKWWNKKNKVSDNNFTIENESTDNNVLNSSNHSNKEKTNGRNHADFSIMDTNGKNSFEPIDDSRNNTLPETNCEYVDASSGHKKHKKTKKGKRSKNERSSRHDKVEKTKHERNKEENTKHERNMEEKTKHERNKEEKTKHEREKEKDLKKKSQHKYPDQNGYISTEKSSSGSCTNTPPIDNSAALPFENPKQNPSILSDKGFSGKFLNTSNDRSDNLSDDNENHTTDQRRCKTARFERDHSDLKRKIGNTASENLRPYTARNSNTSNVGPPNRELQVQNYLQGTSA